MEKLFDILYQMNRISFPSEKLYFPMEKFTKNSDVKLSLERKDELIAKITKPI